MIATNLAAGLPAGGYGTVAAFAGAHGGTVPYGSNVLVGEAGPEIVRLGAGAQVLPNAGSGGVANKVLNLTINMNAPSFESRQMIAQVVQEIDDDGGWENLFADRR